MGGGGGLVNRVAEDIKLKNNKDFQKLFKLIYFWHTADLLLPL